jgi:hypothetical protein
MSELPMELVATQNVGAHSAATTIVSYLLLARFSEPKLEWTYTTPYLLTTRVKFQELPHEYVTVPAALAEPAYLFIFNEVGVRTDYYTSYENSVVISSGTYAGTYVPAPFSFDTVKVGLKLDEEKIEIKSFRFNANPLNKMWPFALDGILTVTIVEVDAANPTSESAIVRFYGDIWSIDSDYKAVAIPFGNFFSRKFPRFLLSVSDNYTQFSPPTQISASSFVVTGTISGAVDTTAQTLVVTSATGHAKEQDYFAGGWLETGSGNTFESRGILHSESTGTNQVTLHIDRPLLKAAGNQALNFYPGYDGSIDQCADKFANRINFGGHPYIPNVNPAVKAVKVKQVQGGKKSA